MHVILEPLLLERAVFLATRADPLLNHEYQRAFASCYRAPDDERRERAFTDLHEQWFNRLGLRGRILDRIRLFPHISGKIRRLVVSDAKARSCASVELFGKPGDHVLVMGLTASLLLDEPIFDYWARFELQHVEDMLDPPFAHDKDAMPSHASGEIAARVRDRFALLWAITIDCRLSALPTAPPALRDHRRVELMRAFNLHDQAAGDRAINLLWPLSNAPVRPPHPELLQWAQGRLPCVSDAESTQRPSPSAPKGGSRCPLCRFPTFDWADVAALSEPTLRAIRDDFPAWSPDDGICGRCAELCRGRGRPAAAAALTG